MENEYDDVVVGAGAAGCCWPTASTRIPTQVLPVEAGGSTIDDMIRVPKGFVLPAQRRKVRLQVLFVTR